MQTTVLDSFDLLQHQSKASTLLSHVLKQPNMQKTACVAQEVYGGLYHEGNVAMSGIHTHSGPGGYLQYILYIITSLGFVRESFDVLVGGIVEVRAHHNGHKLQPALLPFWRLVT